MMNHHLTREQLIGYIHQTLTDAEREEIDRHLSECAECRGMLGDHEAMQRRIRYGLLQDLRKAQPSSKMTFAAVAPRLKRFSFRRLTGLNMLWLMVDQPLSAVATAVMMTLLVVGIVVFFTRGKPDELNGGLSGTMFRGNPQHTGVYNPAPIPLKGELAWSFKTGNQIWTSPALADDTLYFSSTDRYLYALDSRNGQLKWKSAISAPSFSSPAVAAGLVYFGSDTAIYALDSQTGQQKWKFETENVMPADSSPLVVGDVLYFNTSRYFYALDSQTGQERWKFKSGGSATVSSPAFAEGMVFFGGYYLYALDGQTGQLKWKFNMGGYVDSSPAVSEGMVYVGSYDKGVYAVDIQTGQLKWKFVTSEAVFSSPAVANGHVYIGSGYTLYALNSQTGELAWKFMTKGYLKSSPSIAGNEVYFGSFDSYFYALDSQTGQEKWKFQAEAPIKSSALIANGMIYFGSEDHQFYALR